MMFTAIPRQSLELSAREFWALLKGLFFTNEKKIDEFEEYFAKFIGIKYAISFSSLRSGLYCSLKNLGFKKRKEIILPAYGFYAVPAVVVLTGFKPVFVDVNPQNYTIEPEKIEKAITPKTKAIVVAHLNGYPADMVKIMKIARKYKLRVIEDCAHACGSEFRGKKLGSFDIGCFSFGPGKNLSTMGGGMITTNDSVLVEDLKKLRTLPKKENLWLRLKIFIKAVLMRLLTFPPVFFFTGYLLLLLAQSINLSFLLKRLEEKIEIPAKPPLPTSLSPFQSLMGIEQLRQLEKRNQARTENAFLYNKALAKIKQIQVLSLTKDGKNIYLHYPIHIENINQFIKKLALKRIDIQKEYCSDCNELEIFKEFKTNCPVAKSLKDKLVYLPNHPSLDKEKIGFVIKEVKNYFQK